ncbi:MAG TPA: tetratricopeptide repeat protein [Terriglobales bacterium]|nr:tetratricopeptide repeat protein [Terriglobales bacterium]
MRLHRYVGILLVLSSFSFANIPLHSRGKRSSGVLPISTRSAQARKMFQRGVAKMEYLRRSEALESLRAAVKADPKFVQAHILISHLTRDAQEQQASLQKAEQFVSAVTPGEKLLVTWLAGVQEEKEVPAIAAMNDLLAQYPKDKWLQFLAGRWLLNQGRYSQAIMILQRAVTLDANYPAAWNELAYAYAWSGDFDRAFSAMDRYVALQPDEPNPHDSYGEVLRLAGKFDAALEQYRTSIHIDPHFGSEAGVADTLAIMGKEEEAREEYERAIVFAPGETERIEYELQSALTWVRENNRRSAEHALREVAKHAHKAGCAQLEAESRRVLAIYDPDFKNSLKQLDAAQATIEEHPLSRTNHDEELARILRVQALRAAESQAPDIADTALRQLEKMAANSRNQEIQRSFHGARGAVLVAQTKYAEAVPELEEDAEDPISIRLLWRAYSSSGATAQAQLIADKLANFNIPSFEQALVVPQFRASMVSQAH